MQIKLMEKQKCLGRIEDNKYSAPMPMIGLYITTATLVCLILMICDVFHGYRRRKPWLPCRFFSLNSLTLSLLAISTKLPVDLTTPMPSAQDQLSKLCGTILVCISMGFFLPSIVNMEGSELLVNMASLTILVVSVAVNICIQIATGVIHSGLIVEHLITLTLMLLILIIMWYVTFIGDYVADAFSDTWRKRIKDDYQKTDVALSWTGRFKLQYVFSYIYNPELRVCLVAHYPTVGMLCTLSPVVLFEVAFRSLFLKQLKFWEGVSDYRWSIWIVIASQIITLVFGTLAITFRWFFVASQMDPFQTDGNVTWSKWSCAQFQAFKLFATILLNWKMYSGIMITFRVLEVAVIHVLFATDMVLRWTDKVVVCLTWPTRRLIPWFKRNTIGIPTSSYLYLLERGIEDLNSLRNEWKKHKPRCLIQLLSKIHPSQEPHSNEGSNSFLLLVILARLADFLLPPDLGKPLVDALDEAFSIIHFIDQRVDSLGVQNKYKRRLAEDLWMGRDINNHWFETKVINHLRMKYPRLVKISLDADFLESQAQAVPNNALGIIEEFGTLLNLFFPSSECLVIKDFIENVKHGTFKELYEGMEQLLVNKLSLFLIELPNVTLEYVLQSPAGEVEERTRIVLQFLYKFEQLESQIPWLSVKNNVRNKRSTDAPSPATNTIESAPVEGNEATMVAPSGAIHAGKTVLVAHGVEIIEVHQ